MKNVLDLVTEFVEQKLQLQSKKRQLRAKVVKTGEAVFLQHVMPVVNNIVRRLIVEKGLNPDYVPPPPPPKVEERPRPTWVAPHTPPWLVAAIKKKDYSKHPVIRTRRELQADGGLRDRAWEQEQAEAERAVASVAAAAPEPPLQVAEVVTEQDNNALENLGKFLAEFDKLVMKMPDDAPVKSAKRPKRHGRKKSSRKETSAKVTKNFGGYFRRVAEE